MTAPRYVRAPGLQAIAMDGELVMMGMEQGEYFAMRGVAATVWELLSEPRSIGELSQLVADEYGVSVATCEPDIVAFIDQLDAKQLVLPA